MYIAVLVSLDYYSNVHSYPYVRIGYLAYKCTLTLGPPHSLCPQDIGLAASHRDPLG